MNVEAVERAFSQYEFCPPHPRPGGFKDVYFVRVGTDERVLKVYRSPVESDSETSDEALTNADAERIRREIEAISQHMHAGVVSLVEGPGLAEIDGAFYVWYLEPRFEGTLADENLFERFAGAGVGDFLQQTLRALEAVHEGGWIHRDIKPDNIAVDRDGRLILIDFGIAFSPARQRVTDPGSLGPRTPEFAAPEQFEPGNTPDRRTDLYQLGVVAYLLATRSHPFLETGVTARADPEKYRLRQAKGPDRATLDASGIAPGVATVIERCLSPEPHARFRNAAQALRTLQGGV